jgi:hypothetical protein
MCLRCCTVMYPSPSGSPENHRKGYCSDGVKQVMKNDDTPDWPQLQGIFESGMTFNPIKFLATVQTVYDTVFLQAQGDNGLTMESEAFMKMLFTHTIYTLDGRCLFKLFPLEMPMSTPLNLLITTICVISWSAVSTIQNEQLCSWNCLDFFFFLLFLTFFKFISFMLIDSLIVVIHYIFLYLQ